jgi:hypothetical protein
VAAPQTATRNGNPEGAPLRGSRGQIFDLEPPQPKRRSRLPEIALGVLLIAGFGLAGLWWQMASTNPTPVIALAVDVDRGDVIDLEDLQLVHIQTDDPLNVLDQHESGEVVGRLALSDMAAGTLLTTDDVTGGSVVEAGDGIVGLALAAGEYPSLAMRAGDMVDVVLTPGSADDSAVDGDLPSILALAEGRVLVAGAMVVEVAEIGNQGDVFVALTTTESEAALVARAASLDRVRLVEVSGGSGS